MNGQNKKATPLGGSGLFDFVAQAGVPRASRFCSRWGGGTPACAFFLSSEILLVSDSGDLWSHFWPQAAGTTRELTLYQRGHGKLGTIRGSSDRRGAGLFKFGLWLIAIC